MRYALFILLAPAIVGIVFIFFLIGPEVHPLFVLLSVVLAYPIGGAFAVAAAGVDHVLKSFSAPARALCVSLVGVAGGLIVAALLPQLERGPVKMPLHEFLWWAFIFSGAVGAGVCSLLNSYLQDTYGWWRRHA